jgi:hypothetical protein
MLPGLLGVAVKNKFKQLMCCDKFSVILDKQTVLEYAEKHCVSGSSGLSTTAVLVVLL